jgi:topoisomerase-4 subunit A
MIRDREYDVSAGNEGSKLLYFTANPNSEAEIVAVYLSSLANARKSYFEYDFAELEIKGRGSKGNILSKHPVRKIDLKEKGESTVGGREIWYDEATGRLNVDKLGVSLGSFIGEDKILVIFKNGSYELTNFELSNRYEPKDIYIIQKFYEGLPISVIHYDSKNKEYYVKRFLVGTSTTGKKFEFITEHRGSKMILATTHYPSEVLLKTKNNSGETEIAQYIMENEIDVKGWRSIGNKVTYDKFVSAKLVTEKIGKLESKKVEKSEEEDDSGDDNSSENKETELAVVNKEEESTEKLEVEIKEVTKLEITKEKTEKEVKAKPIEEKSPKPPTEKKEPKIEEMPVSEEKEEPIKETPSPPPAPPNNDVKFTIEDKRDDGEEFKTTLF